MYLYDVRYLYANELEFETSIDDSELGANTVGLKSGTPTIGLESESPIERLEWGIPADEVIELESKSMVVGGWVIVDKVGWWSSSSSSHNSDMVIQIIQD